MLWHPLSRQPLLFVLCVAAAAFMLSLLRKKRYSSASLDAGPGQGSWPVLPLKSLFLCTLCSLTIYTILPISLWWWMVLALRVVLAKATSPAVCSLIVWGLKGTHKGNRLSPALITPHLPICKWDEKRSCGRASAKWQRREPKGGLANFQWQVTLRTQREPFCLAFL